MVSVGWPRMRCCVGLRSLVVLGIIGMAMIAAFTMRHRMCVWDTWDWSCSSEGRFTPGPEAITQLRRHVAGRLINIATHLKSSMAVSEAPAVELEVMAALLDPRFAPLFPGPIPLQEAWVPEPLSRTRNILSADSETQQHRSHNSTKEDYSQVDNMYTDDNITHDSKLYYSSIDNGSDNIIENNDSYVETLEESSNYLHSMKYINTIDKKSNSESADLLVEYNNNDLFVYGNNQEDPINTIIPLEEQVTVIVDGCGTYPGIIRQVTRQARVLWPEVSILVAVDSRKTSFEVGVSSDYKVTVYT
ncbi:unnamed protein product, partial [Meganyctiphanes norvegica]